MHAYRSRLASTAGPAWFPVFPLSFSSARLELTLAATANTTIYRVNGYNLGRFWEKQGPQHALFLPSPLLKAGANEIILLELDAARANRTISFGVKPDFRYYLSLPLSLSLPPVFCFALN